MPIHSHIQAQVQAARDCARTHRGETPLQFHLSQWAGEANEYSQSKQLFMLAVAAALVQHEREVS